MALSQNSTGWKPHTEYRASRYATVVWVSEPETQASQERLPNERDVAFVVGFLKHRLEIEGERQLSTEVSYLVLVLARPPGEADAFEITQDGPAVEFGYGVYPSAPESWPSTTLRELLHAAIAGVGLREKPGR